jgi:hypothetical protein
MSRTDENAFAKQLLDVARRDVSPEEAERGARIHDRVLRATGAESVGDVVTGGAGHASRAWLSGVGGIGLSLLIGGGLLFLSNPTSQTLEVSSVSEAPKAVESAHLPLDRPSAPAAPSVPMLQASVWALPPVEPAEQASARASNQIVSNKPPQAHEDAAIRKSSRPDDLGIELSALEAARNDLRRGDAAGALTLLDDFDRRFPRPNVRDEATVLRLEVLFALGRDAEARRIGHDFVVRHPDSIYRARVVQLVGEGTP